VDSNGESELMIGKRKASWRRGQDAATSEESAEETGAAEEPNESEVVAFIDSLIGMAFASTEHAESPKSLREFMERTSLQPDADPPAA
jgi:hypothetical protein